MEGKKAPMNGWIASRLQAIRAMCDEINMQSARLTEKEERDRVETILTGIYAALEEE